MNRTGQELYEMYCRKLAQLGCLADEWDDIDEIDRNAWVLLAIELMTDE